METKTTTHGTSKERGATFHGYAPPTSSTTYTPNQFFDVVLPHASRGCLRLVGYLIRKTLGWSDEEGNPQNPEAYVSYRELIETAGVSRGAIKEAIQEALDKRFITCLRLGQPHRANEEGFSALYTLNWDDRERYVSDPEEFDGFFSGNGNLTHIPNDFFDYTIPNEPLAVIQVIGVIIRNTIGWQTKFGMRRQKIEMSFSEIMRRTGIGSRTTISNALKAAIDGCHIRRVERGVFDPCAGVDSKATVYAIRWSDEKPRDDKPKDNDPSSQPALFDLDEGDGSKSGPGNGSENGPATVQEVDSNEFKKRTGIKTTNINNSSKQQQTDPPDVVGGSVSLSLLMGKLLGEGIETETATKLMANFSPERIARQIEWLPLRDVKSSRTGLLIRAIERDMPKPGVQTSEQSPARVFAAHFYAELAGNPDAPTAEPSSEEIRIATEYLVRIGKLDDAQMTGRAFARHIVRAESGRTSMTRTLSLALRLYGDEFYADESSRRKKAMVMTEKQSKAEHEKRMSTVYEAFVSETLSSLLMDESLGRAFEEFTEARLQSRKRMSERAHTMLMEQLRTDQGRQNVFKEFLAKERPGSIPEFWVWDATINKEPFSTEGEH